MIDIIFPAKKIEMGSRIVIWGADITGICFYEQLKSLEYADVITFIDSKVEKIHLNISVNRPDWLITNKYRYDYILIGSVNINAQNEIKRILTYEYDIPEDKIIYDGYMPFIKNSGMADINSAHEVVDMICKFGKNNEISGKSIQYIIDSVKSNEVFEEIENLFINAETLKTKLTCAYIIFSANKGDSVMLEQTYAELKKCSSANPMWAHFFMFNILNSIVGKHPEYRFYDYYLDRKKIICKISKELYKNKSRIEIVNRKKVAIASSIPLLGENWHITRIIAQLADGLKRKGYEVSVFVESKIYSGKEFFIDTFFKNGCDMINYGKSNKKLFGDIDIFYSKGESMIEHANDYVDKIIEYNPSNIIFFGADRTCATRILYDLFPIVYMPMVTAGSNAFCHCIACANINLFLEIDEKYHWIDKKQKLLEYQPALIPPICKKVYNREDRGWGNDQFVVVTVGNRLKYELNSEFIDAVCHEILNSKKLKWIIVGISSVEYIDKEYRSLVEDCKIEFINYESDLAALYKIADAYLNPDRMGGGITIAWAMLEGLPIITLDSAFAGVSWGGSENAVSGNYSDLMDELRRLMYDREYYECRSRKMIENIKKLSSETYISRIIEILGEADKIFNQLKKGVK